MRHAKLCITGSFGNRDIGDEAMLTEDLDFLLTELKIPRENITLIGWNPQYISDYHNHPLERCLPSSLIREHQNNPQTGVKSKCRSALRSILKRKPAGESDSSASHRLIQSAETCDALLVTGGGTVNTRDSGGGSIRMMHALVTFFKQFGKPIFMSGQTIGPLGLIEEHDRLAVEIINSVEFLTVRDNRYSSRYIETVKAKPRRLVETFDDAYTLPYKNQSLPDEVEEFLRLGECAAVNVTAYTSDTHEKRAFVARLCEYLITECSLHVLLVSHAPTDYFHLQTVCDMISNRAKPWVLIPDTRSWRDKTLKKLISRCRVAIGGRYHFIVFAGTSNTPFVGMTGNHYSYIKQDGFARAVGLEDLVCTERESFDTGAVESKTREALSSQMDLEERFQRPSESMRHFGRWLEEWAA